MLLGIGNNQESKFEAVRRQVEGRSGGFDMLRLRFEIVREARYAAEVNPVAARAQENNRRAQAEAEKLRYQEEIERIAESARLETAEAPIVEANYSREAATPATPPHLEPLYDRDGIEQQEKMAADARTAADNARADNALADSNSAPAADTHNFDLRG